jgi:hypothetical protein
MQILARPWRVTLMSSHHMRLTMTVQTDNAISVSHPADWGCQVERTSCRNEESFDALSIIGRAAGTDAEEVSERQLALLYP